MRLPELLPKSLYNYSLCRWERPLLPDIQRKNVLAMLTYASMLRLLGHFFVESQPKLAVLRLQV